MAAAASAPKTGKGSQTALKNKRIGLISEGWRQLGRADEDLPDFIAKHFNGKRSRKQLGLAQLQRCIDLLKEDGYKPKPRRGRRQLLDDGQQAKIRALWISLYWLGVTESNTDASMDLYCKRMQKVDSVRFLRGKKPSAFIEQLKKWASRDAGVKWGATHYHRESVIFAQLKILGRFGYSRRDLLEAALGRLDPPLSVPEFLTLEHRAPSLLDALIVDFGKQIRAHNSEDAGQ